MRLSGIPIASSTFREPETNSVHVLSICRAISQNQVPFLGPAPVIPDWNVYEGEENQKRRVHEKSDDPPERQLSNCPWMADLLVDPAVHAVFLPGAHCLFPGIGDATIHEIPGGDGDQDRHRSRHLAVPRESPRDRKRKGKPIVEHVVGGNQQPS